MSTSPSPAEESDAKTGAQEDLSTGLTPKRAGIVAGDVAVIVPARNEEENIGRCLAAIAKSLGVAGLDGAEVIVVDDESSDATSEIARSLGASVFHQQPRGGPLAAWARGVKETSARYLFFTDADCLVDDEALSLLLDRLSLPAVGVVAARAEPIEGTRSIVTSSGRFSSLLLHEIRSRLGSNDFVPIGRLMGVRREAWHVADDALAWPCDRTVAKLAKDAGWTISYVPEAKVLSELPPTYTALRSDYERTQVARKRLNISYDSLPTRSVVNAGIAALRQAPLDGAAWVVARFMLVGERLRGRLGAGFDYWNPDPSQLRDQPGAGLQRLRRLIRRRDAA